MTRTCGRALAEWAGRVLGGLDERTRALIHLACRDLWHGPLGPDDPREGADWPGFTVACREIQAALEDVPAEVWVDSQSGEVLESEPEGFEDGGEWFEPSWEDITHVGRQDVLPFLLGKDLAGYIR